MIMRKASTMEAARLHLSPANKSQIRLFSLLALYLAAVPLQLAHLLLQSLLLILVVVALALKLADSPLFIVQVFLQAGHVPHHIAHGAPAVNSSLRALADSSQLAHSPVAQHIHAVSQHIRQHLDQQMQLLARATRLPLCLWRQLAQFWGLCLGASK